MLHSFPQTWLKALLKRIAVLIAAIAILMSWRMRIMGGNPPKFQEGDNPSAFASTWILRVSNFCSLVLQIYYFFLHEIKRFFATNDPICWSGIRLVSHHNPAQNFVLKTRHFWPGRNILSETFANLSANIGIYSNFVSKFVLYTPPPGKADLRYTNKKGFVWHS